MMKFLFSGTRPFGALALLSMMLSAHSAAGQEKTPVAGLSFYGYLNQSIQQYDDGVDTINYGRVDNAVNDNVNRFGIVYNQTLSSGWNFGGTLELGLAPKPSNQVSQADRTNSDWKFDVQSLRKLEVTYSSGQYGTFSLGQGDMSGKGPGPDYSGTTVIASSNPAGVAGGNFWRALNGGGLTTRQLNESFSNFSTGRRFRVRYDSRSYRGFSFSTSLGREILIKNDDKSYFDLVGAFTEDWRTISFSVELGLNGLGDKDFAGRVGFSLIHRPSGLNITGIASHSTVGAHFGYVKIGIVRNLFAIGSTAVSIDLYNGGAFAVGAAESLSNGIVIVQRIDSLDMELFASVRNFEGYNNLRIPNENFLTSKAVTAGLSWKF